MSASPQPASEPPGAAAEPPGAAAEPPGGAAEPPGAAAERADAVPEPVAGEPSAGPLTSVPARRAAGGVEHALRMAGRHRHDGHRRSGPAAQMHSLRNGVIALLILTVMVVGLLQAIPGLQTVGHLVFRAQASWIAVALGLEALSCGGYVVLFWAIFPDVPRGLACRLALSELAANSVLSLSGAGGLALGAWVLHGRSMPAETIARRSVVLFLLTSAINVTAVAVLGIGMGLGLFKGPDGVLLTFVPAAVAITVIIVVVVAGLQAQRLARGWALGRRRLRAVLAALGGGVADCLQRLRRPGWPILGSFGYWLFDALVLYVAYRALHFTPALAGVLMAYLVGLLANSLPVPGGLGVVEGGLVGALLLYGAGPARAAIAAVLIYRAISLWLPSLIGIAAFASLRRELRRGSVLTVPEPAEESVIAGEPG